MQTTIMQRRDVVEVQVASYWCCDVQLFEQVPAVTGPCFYLFSVLSITFWSRVQEIKLACRQLFSARGSSPKI